jgi:hypothetical protein
VRATGPLLLCLGVLAACNELAQAPPVHAVVIEAGAGDGGRPADGAPSDGGPSDGAPPAGDGSGARDMGRPARDAAPPADAYAAFLKVWAVMNPAPGQHQRCATCHSGGGPGRPDHSADDPMVAYANAKTVIFPADPPQSRLYQQAVHHQPDVGVRQFDAAEQTLLLDWIRMERQTDAGQPPPPDALLDARTPQYALALDSVALRVAEVPADISELLDLDGQPDDAARKARYDHYVDLYLSLASTPVEAPLALGYRRPGVVENVFTTPGLLPGWPGPVPDDEAADTFELRHIVFEADSQRGELFVYPSPLSRLALQWIGFGGIDSALNNPRIPNQDNYGPMDVLVRAILEDRPIRDAFEAEYAYSDGTTRPVRACIHVPFAGYDTPVMHRQVCRAGAAVTDGSPSGDPVGGGIFGSRGFNRVQYGHYKFHTIRSAFQAFHCKDFPVYTTALVHDGDDAAARAHVVSPWADVGTTPYCASCHAVSNMNAMALTFWKFDDQTGVLRDRFVAVRPDGSRVHGPGDLVTSQVDPNVFHYEDQDVPSFQAWVDAFVDDPDFARCGVAQVYDFAMGRGRADLPENRVPDEVIDRLIADYEAVNGAGSIRSMTVLKMLAVVFKSDDFTRR